MALARAAKLIGVVREAAHFFEDMIVIDGDESVFYRCAQKRYRRRISPRGRSS